MDVCVEPLEEATALWARFEQFIYRTAAEREGRDDACSTAGDALRTRLAHHKHMGINLALVLNHSLEAADLVAFPERVLSSVRMQQFGRTVMASDAPTMVKPGAGE